MFPNTLPNSNHIPYITSNQTQTKSTNIYQPSNSFNRGPTLNPWVQKAPSEGYRSTSSANIPRCRHCRKCRTAQTQTPAGHCSLVPWKLSEELTLPKHGEGLPNSKTQLSMSTGRTNCRDHFKDLEESVGRQGCSAKSSTEH